MDQTNLIRSLDVISLLFFRKIESLEYWSDSQTLEFSWKKDTSAFPIITLKSSTDQLKYIVHRHHCKIGRHNTLQRENLTETEYIFAFPISRNQSNNKKKFKVYNYLPIRECGFTFYLNIDLLLTASREEIHQDEAHDWNKKLISHLPQAFCSALNVFKSDLLISESYSLLEYVPRRKMVAADPVFEPIVSSIIEILSNTDCVKSKLGSWEKPRNVIWCNDRVIRELMKDDMSKLSEKKIAVGLEFVQKDILHALQIQEVSFDWFLNEISLNNNFFSNKDDSFFLSLLDILCGKEFIPRNIFELVLWPVQGNSKSLEKAGNIYLSSEKEIHQIQIASNNENNYLENFRFLRFSLFERLNAAQKKLMIDFATEMYTE